jgi:signal transduction histidine kinase
MGHRTVVTVLVASMLVAGALAWQAVTAARQRQAASDAMLRQYAQLAAWEFAREARKEIDKVISRTLAGHVHPDRKAGADPCDCAPLDGVEHWFEVPAGGTIGDRSGRLTPDTMQQLARVVTVEGSNADAGVRLWRLPAPSESGRLPGRVEGPDGDARIAAVRWEPHVGSSGGHLGLVVSPRALAPVLAKTLERAALLPPVLVAGRDARRLIHLRVRDGAGATLFVSPGTNPGPQAFETDLLADTTAGLRLEASLTPAFVAGLGPEHGAGPGRVLVLGLLAVNALLVAIGLWQIARERELARLRADFVTGVSHELRTPLAQIRMFAETLLLDRVRSPEERRRALEIIGQETRRLGQLVENVVYFHRHERLPAAPPADLVDLVPLVRDVVEGFAPLAASRRAQIEFCAAAPGALVHASADGLRQVVLNLLDNAVKFGPPGQIVRVLVDRHDDQVRIVVVDRGPGIPAADQRRIFKPFERGRATRGSGGAGIGLAVVSQIVASHGGRVEVDPSADSGARLIVTLPKAPDAPRATPVSLAG